MTAKQRHDMGRMPLYPLRFEPIYQYRLWGGRRLADLLTAPLPGDGPIGEAWLLSDRDDHPSRVADGPLKGTDHRAIAGAVAGAIAGKTGRAFPPVPPAAEVPRRAAKCSRSRCIPRIAQTEYLPAGETGKTEAWVVLEAGPESRIYAGLKPGTTADDLRRALANGTVADQLACFTPRPGDAVFLPAGTVHSLGGGVVVFEVQENSDVTFRLYDWDHVDARDRPAAASASRSGDGLHRFRARSRSVRWRRWWRRRRRCVRERLFHCEHFSVVAAPRTIAVHRRRGGYAARAGMHRRRRGRWSTTAPTYAVGKGDVLLLPAVVGACSFRPRGAVSLLEIALPE